MERLAAGDDFPNLGLESEDGRVRLRERWSERVVVLAFMRHFGCSFCREYLTRLAAADADLSRAGADVVAVFQYDAAATAGYCDGRGVPFDCLGDPLGEAYARVGIGRGTLRQLMGWKVIRRAREAYRVGGFEAPDGADFRLMPGTFVIGQGGRIALAHYSENAADNPPIEAVLDAVRSAA